MNFRVSELSLRSLRRAIILQVLKCIAFQLLIVFPIIFALELVSLDKGEIAKIPSLFSYYLELFVFAFSIVILAAVFAFNKIYRQFAYTTAEISNRELVLSKSKTMKKYLGRSFRKVVVVSPPWFMRFYFDGVLYRQIILLRKGFHLFSFPIIVRLERYDLAIDFARQIGEDLGVSVYLQRWHGLDKKI